MKRFPRIAITAGEPAGIGPDLCCYMAHHAFDAELVVLADPQMLEQRAKLLGLSLNIEYYVAASPAQKHKPGTLKILDQRLASAAQCGQLQILNAPYVLRTLDRAVSGCMRGEFSALVTGPIHKGVINDAMIARGESYHFSGHTEYLAQATDTRLPVMMLECEQFRVALVTTHLPLRQVSDAITKERLQQVLEILHTDLRQRYGIADPVIYVSGLNPHAGEQGHLGYEEIEIINPVLSQLRARGMRIKGALAADTLFSPDNIAKADAFLVMYHDQGLPVLKTVGFGRSINITLGLPIIRTSVDHGTALELAGSGNINDGSFVLAINKAIELANSANSVANQYVAT